MASWHNIITYFYDIREFLTVPFALNAYAYHTLLYVYNFYSEPQDLGQ